MSPPLNGILVADFSRVLAGPLCTMMLADAGARVIKIEEPQRGDETRHWGPPFVAGESAYFLSVNRGKESIALDLKSEQGRSVAAQLIARADVVVENFLPAQRNRLGLSEGQVRALNPRAIICSIVGFPGDSAEANVPGYDLLAQATGGLMSITGEPDGQPMRVGVALADVLTAHYAHGAILSALYGRERTGRAEAIEVSLLGSTVASMVNVAQSHLITGEETRRWGNAHPSIVPYQAFQASDGMFVLAVGTDRQFSVLCRDVLGRAELAIDERFAVNAARVVNRQSLVEILQALFLTAAREIWVQRCRAFNVPVAPVQTVCEVFRHASESTITIDHPVAGNYQTVRNPLRGVGRATAISPPPTLGQHTQAILRELGLDE